LKPDVLRVALYRLGLDPTQFDDVYGDIGKLIGLRNNIAHGATKSGVDANLYESYESAAFRVMNKIGRCDGCSEKQGLSTVDWRTSPKLEQLTKFRPFARRMVLPNLENRRLAS
jgi:hypothetical protein